MTTRDCEGLTTRQINQLVRELVAEGETELCLQNPGAQHNLLVGLFADVRITLEGAPATFAPA